MSSSIAGSGTCSVGENFGSVLWPVAREQADERPELCGLSGRLAPCSLALIVLALIVLALIVLVCHGVSDHEECGAGIVPSAPATRLDTTGRSIARRRPGRGSGDDGAGFVA